MTSSNATDPAGASLMDLINEVRSAAFAPIDSSNTDCILVGWSTAVCASMDSSSATVCTSVDLSCSLFCFFKSPFAAS